MIKYTLFYTELKSHPPNNQMAPVQCSIDFEAKDDVDAWIWVRRFINHGVTIKMKEDRGATREALRLSRDVNLPSAGF